MQKRKILKKFTGMDAIFLIFIMPCFFLSCATHWHRNLITLDSGVICREEQDTREEDSAYSKFQDAVGVIDKVAESFEMKKSDLPPDIYEKDGIEYKYFADYSKAKNFFETAVFFMVSISTDYERVIINIVDMTGSKIESEFTKSLTKALSQELKTIYDECQYNCSVFYTKPGWFAP